MKKAIHTAALILSAAIITASAVRAASAVSVEPASAYFNSHTRLHMNHFSLAAVDPYDPFGLYHMVISPAGAPLATGSDYDDEFSLPSALLNIASPSDYYDFNYVDAKYSNCGIDLLP